MKKLLVVFFLLFFFSSIYAQDAAWPVEIFCVTEQLPASPIMTFTMTAQSSRWDVISDPTPVYPPQQSYFFLTNDYTVETYIPTANNLGQNSAGFEFVGLSNAGFPLIGFGLYKVTNNLNNKYFYLDYRDYRAIYLVHYQPNDSTWQNSIDIWIKYNGQTSTFSYSAKGSSTGFSVIENGQLLNLWDIKQKGTPLTNLFPDYWDNCLAVIDNGSSKPRLVWGPYPGDRTLIEVTYYEIWRKFGSGNWTLLDYVSGNTFTYEDNELTLAGQQSGTSVLYKIRAVQSALPENLLSNYSNTASVVVSGEDPEKRNLGSYEEINVNSFKLSQNYPNPFNPTTNIRFSIPENSYVTLKVYDILGKVVAELVNGSMEAGNHSINFDAANLTSGLYFYTLSANGYSETKKMILAK